MQSISVELTDEQVEKIKELSAVHLEAAGVSGGDAAVGWALSALGGYLIGKGLDSIANADGDISGRQISEYYAA